jgi:hypothetical protein
MNLTYYIQSLIGKIPFLSGLRNCRGRDFWYALQEFVVTLIFSTIPIWLGAFVIHLSNKIGEDNFLSALKCNINNGELFLYSAAMVAPIFYIALNNYPGSKEFPNRLSHMIAVFVLTVLSAVAFGLQRVGIQFETSRSFRMSYIFFIISLCLLYIALVYKNRALPDVAEEMRSSEDKFTQKFLEHR